MNFLQPFSKEEGVKKRFKTIEGKSQIDDIGF